MSDKLRIAVNGAAGRMGQRVIAAVHQDRELELIAAIEAAGHPRLGQDAGELAGIGRLGIRIGTELPEEVECVIDFSIPAGAAAIAARCADMRTPLVVATTGLHGAEREAVLTASQMTAVLISPSMSLAVNLTMKLVRDAAKTLTALGSEVDVEIIEKHHRFKEDAPSGTALKFGEIVAKEMGQTEEAHGRHGRPGVRPRSEIGYHAVRIGDNVGEHAILFGMLGETIELNVRSSNRDAYAYGAVAAAKFLAGKGAGLYSMSDVLGF